jgi:cytochrome c oxidase cbb3-type subunit 3
MFMRSLRTMLLLLFVSPTAFAQFPPAFPGLMRPPGDPSEIARGNQLYSSLCRACHGADLRGGDLGGPNLLRSQLVLNDQAGEAIGPVVLNGRTPVVGAAMPPLTLPAADIRALATYVHSVIAKAQPQGAPPSGEVSALRVLVGNARAGQRYFDAHCKACHGATTDLAGIATRIPDPEHLQSSWVAGRVTASAAMGGPPTASGPNTNPRRAVKITLRFADGQSLRGTLLRLDDFVVSLTDEAGAYRSFVRRHASPAIAAITVDDPLAQHRRLLVNYTDRDMHNVTAYLATLK